MLTSILAIIGGIVGYVTIWGLVYRFCWSRRGLDFEDRFHASVVAVLWPLLFPIVCIVYLGHIVAGEWEVPELFRVRPLHWLAERRLNARMQQIKLRAEALAQSRREIMALAKEIEALGDTRGAEQIRALLESHD